MLAHAWIRNALKTSAHIHVLNMSKSRVQKCVCVCVCVFNTQAKKAPDNSIDFIKNPSTDALAFPGKWIVCLKSLSLHIDWSLLLLRSLASTTLCILAFIASYLLCLFLQQHTKKNVADPPHAFAWNAQCFLNCGRCRCSDNPKCTPLSNVRYLGCVHLSHGNWHILALSACVFV